MDESATRRKKIDPKLYEVGWKTSCSELRRSAMH